MKFNIKLWVLTCLFMILLVSSICFADLNTGLYHYYKADELTTGDLVDSIGNANLIEVGGTTGNQTGKIGGSRGTFNGNVLLSTSFYPFNYNTNFTVSMWVYMLATNPLNEVWFVNDHTNNSYFLYQIYSNGGSLTFSTGKGATGSNDCVYSGGLLSGQWYHLVNTFNGTTNACYVNNVSMTPVAYTYGELATTNKFRLGNSAGSTNPSDQDADSIYVDELGIWNRTLNISEIGELYNNNLSKTYPFSTNPIVINSINITAQYLNNDNTTDLAYWDANNLTCQANVSGSDNLSYSWYRNNNTISNWCYQETTTQPTGCGGLNTGSYELSGSWASTVFGGGEASYDGNWNSYASNAYPSGSNVYINYSKPFNSQSNSLWLIKLETSGIFNMSIPISCWNYMADKISFRFDSNSDSTGKAYCKNSTTTYKLIFSGVGDFPIYEEAMWWYINPIVLNSSYYSINDNISCQIKAYNGTFNTTNSRNITIQPPQLNYINILNTSTIEEQNLTCNYSILHPDNIIIDWLSNVTLFKSNSLYFNMVDYNNSLLNLPLQCRINSTVKSKSYTSYNNSNKIIVGQNITFSAKVNHSSNSVINFSICYSIGCFNTTNGNLTVWNYNVSDTYIFYNSIYELKNVTLTTNILNQSYTFYVWDAQSINFTFYNQNFVKLSNVSVILYNSYFNQSYNYSTDNGNLYVYLLSPSDYEVIATSTGYDSSSTFLTISQNSYQQKNIFLMNSTSSILVTYTLIYSDGSAVISHSLKLLKYDTITSTWQYVQECKTDTTGQCSMYVVEPDYYRYAVFDEFGNNVKTTDNDFVVYSEKTIMVDKSYENLFETLNAINQIKNTLYYDVSVINNTGDFTIRALWSNSDISKVCMKLYTSNITKRTSLFNDCIEINNQAQIYETGIVLQNLTYSFDIYAIYSNTNEYTIYSQEIDLYKPYEKTGKLGIFLSFLIIVLCTLIGIPSPKRMIFMANIGLIATVIIGINPLSWYAIAGVIVASLIAIYLIRV